MSKYSLPFILCAQKFSLLFVLAFTTANASPLNETNSTVCSPLVGTCEYYDCVEKNLISCGETGYTIGYGKFYCEKFKAVLPQPVFSNHERELFPVDWHLWLQKTAICLHSAIDNHIATTEMQTCENLRNAAFKSHASCYTSDDSFCFLPPQQIAQIGGIISLRGFSQPETILQVQQTANICVQQVNNRISVENSLQNKIELTIYKNAWSLIAHDPEKSFQDLQEKAQ